MTYEAISMRPPIWARGGHLQTVLGHFLRMGTRLPCGEDLDIPLEDGDVLAATFYPGTSGTVICLFHGLGGNISAGYMMRVAKLCLNQGHSVMLVNHRGCGRGRAIAHRNPYHSGRAEDLSAAIADGRKRRPHDQHIAIGFSLSGNALLLLLSGKRGTVQPDAAIAVNAPIDLHSAALRLHQGFNRVYDFRFVQDCRRDVNAKKAKGWVPASLKIPIASTLYELDAIYTAQRAGFKSREDYYETCSTAPLLGQIQKPTVIITAKDDPFVDVRNYLKSKVSPLVTLKIVDTGGHMGYLAQGKGLLGYFHWLEDEIQRSLASFRKEE